MKTILAWPTRYHDMTPEKREAALRRLAAQTGGKIVGHVVKISNYCGKLPAGVSRIFA
jgi:hypothetical protein